MAPGAESILFQVVTTVAQPAVLAAVLLGVMVGIFVGALPGLTATLAMAVFSPLTFFMSPVVGISFLIGLYKGGTFGGAISAILLGTPGTASNAATTLDGYPMARDGRGADAIRLACFGSAIGDFFSNCTLVLLAAPMAAIALMFGPPEIFGIITFSLLLVAVLSARDLVKGLIAGLLGFLLATIGIDTVTGTFRFTFGVSELQGGVPFIAMMIGLFGVGEILAQINRRVRYGGGERAGLGADRSAVTLLSTVRAYWPTILRSTGIGVGLGALPGVGAETSSWVAYGIAKTRSKKSASFGRGEPEGVVAPEVANNAVCGATLIPLLAFGIPGDVVTAVMLGAFVAQGLRPGPVLFQQHYDVLYALYVTSFIATVGLVVVTVLTTRLWVKILMIPTRIIYPIILVLCVVGTFANNNSVSDVVFMLGFGVLGFAMRLTGFPVPPMVLAFVLGPMFEQSLQQSLVLVGGNPIGILQRPIAGTILALTACVVVVLVGRRLARLRRRVDEA